MKKQKEEKVLGKKRLKEFKGASFKSAALGGEIIGHAKPSKIF